MSDAEEETFSRAEGRIAVQVELTLICEFDEYPTLPQLAKLVDEARAWDALDSATSLEVHKGGAKVQFMVPAKARPPLGLDSPLRHQLGLSPEFPAHLLPPKDGGEQDTP